MDPEIASFVLKFQNLSCAGKSANLSSTSTGGNVSVNLSYEIGTVKSVSESPKTHHVRCLQRLPSKVHQEDEEYKEDQKHAEPLPRRLLQICLLKKKK